MDNQEIKDYIQSAFRSGKSKEEIYRELLSRGWSVDVINDAFNLSSTGEERGQDTKKKTVKVILFAGVILIGAGIFSFIASNWQEMSRPMKLSVIVLFMLASYAAGWFLKEKKGYVKTGEALFLLGSIIYGAGIFLVAQMFNIRASWPDGFILWMIGTLVLAYVIDSAPLFYLAFPVGLVAIIGYPFEFFEFFFDDGFPGAERFAKTSSILLIIATATAFLAGWLNRRKMSEEHKEFF